MAWILDCLFASAFEPRPRRVSVLGGAPGHNPDRRTKMISIHSLSELERLKLQETAYHELVARHFLSEFNPERVVSLKTFGIRLEEALVNELTRRKHLELRTTMQIEEPTGQAGRRRGNVVQRMFGRIRRFFNRRRDEPSLPPEFTRRGRRGAVSVDSLAELEDGALLLQTLQLSKISFPIGQRLLGSKRKMSLNPIAKQIPQVVEACCNFIEKHGLSTVGIFTLEFSAARVRQLRDEFDQGLDVVLDDTQNVHDVAALLREFFRDMKDSLLPDDLYMSFLLTATLKPQDQLSALQLLVYLMPPCHSDTLERLLKALHKITENCEDSIGIDGQLVPGNRMTSTNLALVFGSALLKKGRFAKRESRKTRLGIDHYVASVNVVRSMIDNWDILFQVPPHIQRQVAKRVWKSSPEALDFIRRRNLRRIQSARIKMEEDALLSDPVENSAEAQAAVLAQSKPFDEGQFPAGGQALAEGQSLAEGQAPPEGQVLAEDEPLEEDEYSEEDVSVNEELALAYLIQRVVFEIQGFEIPNDPKIQDLYLEGIPELDEEDDSYDDDDEDTLNFDDLPPLEDILEHEDEIPELIEVPDFEEMPYFDMVPVPEGAPDLQEILNPGENPNHNLEEGPDFEDYQNLDLDLDVIQNNEEASDSDEIPDSEDAPGTDEIPDHVDASDNDENPDAEEVPNLEEVPVVDEVPNDEASNVEEILDYENAPEVNEISDSEEDLDFEEVPALHVVPSPEEAPSNHQIPNHEQFLGVNGFSDSGEDLNFEEIPLGGVPNDEENSDAEEILDNEETPEVNGIAGSEEHSNPEEVPALHVVTGSEDVPDFDEIQNDEASGDSEVVNDEESSDVEEIPSHKEDSDVSRIQDSEENSTLEVDSVADVVPEQKHAPILNEIPDTQNDQTNTFEEQVPAVCPEPEDVSTISSIPDLQKDLAVNLEEAMNVEAVPVQKDFDPNEVQNSKAIQFHKEDVGVAFPVDTTLLKSKSPPGQVMNYKSFPESLKINISFLPSVQYCSSEEPAVPPGTARSHDDEEGAGNPPIPEQDRPLLRVPREKEAKTDIGYFFP